MSVRLFGAEDEEAPVWEGVAFAADVVGEGVAVAADVVGAVEDVLVAADWVEGAECDEDEEEESEEEKSSRETPAEGSCLLSVVVLDPLV